jgi:pectate lyase
MQTIPKFSLVLLLYIGSSVLFLQSARTQDCPDFVIEGFGKNTTGGCRGTIYKVTNLNDMGPGSLREFAQNTSGPRIIKFAVSGWITLNSELYINNPDITIDGSDAPNGGIGFRNSTVNIQTNNVIVRHVRFRSGPGIAGFKRPNAGSSDALRIDGSRAFNVVLDHVSASWGLDESASIVGGAHDVTIQWSIISEGLNCNPTNPHPKGCHSRGLLINAGATNITLHHNLMVHNAGRNPDINVGNVDVVNNLVYNGGSVSGPVIEMWETIRANIVGNYLKGGESFSHAKYKYSVRIHEARANDAQVYMFGNLGYQRPTDNLPQEDIFPHGDSERKYYVVTRHNFPRVTTTPALEARNEVLAHAGAVLPCRDTVDLRLIDQATRGTATDLKTIVPSTGHIINDPSDVGGWPDLAKSCEVTRRQLGGTK